MDPSRADADTSGTVQVTYVIVWVKGRCQFTATCCQFATAPCELMISCLVQFIYNELKVHCGVDIHSYVASVDTSVVVSYTGGCGGHG